ncbi:SIS domain-containing protein [Chitinibacter fontanus]|uniref:Glutamine--fructose-6-phosphate aminotransferase [isomerizing] n=1 Tax=Chitinibacter fontanus TaxID=1737446 RepID=A0A7D5VAC5_9NEIS|nr:SIS domain-containing protein [Chitinibacter fontanus]QLI82036.1 SIS domain-containing protein [Chitinibacter fontanus]
MPELIALIAPQNVLPALTEHLGALGTQENQASILFDSMDGIQLERLTLEQPVQKIAPGANSRWVLSSVGTTQQFPPYLHQNRLVIAALGSCHNHQELAREYRLDSHCPLNLLLATLLHPQLQQGISLSDALIQTSKLLRGDLALICQDTHEPQHWYACNLGLPLSIGMESGLRQICTTSTHLAQQVANPIHQIKLGEVIQFGLSAPARCNFRQAPETLILSPNKGQQVPHHMLEEIESQPLILSALVDRYFTDRTFPSPLLAKLSGICSINLVASGSSYHAALIASYWFESLAGLKTQVDIASEYRYRDIRPDNKELLIAISQSGETTDTVEAVRHAQAAGHPYCLALCNAPHSTLVSISDFTLLTHSGTELSVSSTKSFTAQLLVLFQLAVKIGQIRNHLGSERIAACHAEMQSLGAKVHATLEHSKELRRWAGQLHNYENLFVIGRHAMYPVALEGAFKFKEVAYQYATGFAAGELKHGPITLINANLPVIACLPWNQHAERMLSNLHEIRANQGELFVLCDGALASSDKFSVIRLPAGLLELAPICYIAALQLLAYHCAVLRGNTIDSHRLLSKAQTRDDRRVALADIQ